MSKSIQLFVLIALLWFVLIVQATAQTCPCSIWSATSAPITTDSADTTAVELGLKFRVDTDGYVIGVRFYKSAANLGPHVGSVWTTSGTLLGSATFVNETGSGWQQVLFASPVPVTSGSTYIVSYFAPNGHYAFDENAFAWAGVDNAPLHALMNGVDGENGVYKYGASSAFPDQSYGSSNYWVDVVYVSSTAPSVRAVTPVSGSSDTKVIAPLTVTFNVPMDTSSLTADVFGLQDSNNNVISGQLSYDVASAKLTFVPEAPLQPATTYSAKVKGSVRSVFGTAMGADYSWSFTSEAAPPTSGPGGPILVISSVRNPFSQYLSEILLAEGLNEFTVQDISTLTPQDLATHDVAILGEIPLTSAQASMLTSWVGGGGNLIAMRPDKQLSGLLGLTSTTGTLANAYLQINTASSPGVGIVGDTIQFHGTADLYTLNGATGVATLYSNASAATSYPAVTLTNAGNGLAAAFTYDLARSIVYTRQGNPQWSGQDRDQLVDPAIGTSQIRSNDLFFGNASFDPQPDWIDFDKVQIPQADEQQRLLANLILLMNSSKKPLPRFWYFPGEYKAAIIMTGDDHGGAGTIGRFDRYLELSDPGCSVEDWTCIRSTSYVLATADSERYTNYAAYVDQGFEIALHPDTIPTCTEWDAVGLDQAYATELENFHAIFPGLPPSRTTRMHCVLWSDYDSQPKVEAKHKIQLDTNYYYWPGPWVLDRPGMFTGSGIPMRFADRNGNLVDVYQVPTQMTDEPPDPKQSYPMNSDVLLGNATGPLGYYGAFVANMHTDVAPSDDSDRIIASATDLNVPVVSALQMLNWLEGRNSSSFDSLIWAGNTLTFTISPGSGARNLRAMLPVGANGGALNALTSGGLPVSYTTEIIKGVQYAVFAAVAGSYQATYAGTSYSISGKIDGPGAAGATVTLTGSKNATTVADSSGFYRFTGLADGSYMVTPTKPGYYYTPSAAAVTISGSGQTTDFASAIQTYSISGQIVGNGANGATVTLTGTSSATTTTDNSGMYTFTGLLNGTYTVAPSKSNYLFAPGSSSVTINYGNQVTNFVVDAPTVDSVTPTGGTGPATFVFKFSNPGGYASLSQVQGIINFSVNYGEACAFVYYPARNTIYLFSDDGTTRVGPATVGVSGSVSNSQCAIDGAGARASGTGAQLTLTLPVTFANSFLTKRNIYAFAANSVMRSGWQQIGTWTPSTGVPVPVAPTVDSVSPNTASGASQNLTFQYSSVNGYAYIGWVQGIINTSVAYQSSCSFNYNRASNQLFLMNDAGTSWIGPKMVGSSGTLSNTQCTINTGTSSFTGSGNSLRLTLAVTATPAVSGRQNIYSYVADQANMRSGWMTLGTWLPNPPQSPTVPKAVSVTSAVPGTTAFTFASDNGGSYISAVQTILGSKLDYPNSCALYYFPSNNRLYLMNDAGNKWLGPVLLGQPGTISNTQCTIDAATSSAGVAGNNLTLSVTATYTPAFSGIQKAWGYAIDKANRSSWTNLGQVTLQ